MAPEGIQCDTKPSNEKLISEVLKTYTINEVAEKLCLARGTVKRWVDLNNVPTLYQFDLMKLIGRQIDYINYTSKDKDQFFTEVATARHCYDIFTRLLQSFGEDESKFWYIEPSAGDGSFMKVLPSQRTVGLDIEPRFEGVLKNDYLTWQPQDKNKSYVVFGNPPFGLRGNLALRFINHSYNFAEYVCFILPQLFESDGKGVPRKRVKGFNLIHSEKLDTTFHGPESTEPIQINVIFQVWSKRHINERYRLEDLKNDVLQVYSLSDGETPSQIRNKKMLHNCDAYLPSTCFGDENMKCYDSFDELPGRRGYGIVFLRDKEANIEKCKSINWAAVSFLSTNSAYNLRTSIITAHLLEHL